MNDQDNEKGYLLKGENTVIIYTDRGIREEPKDPLTEQEKEHLRKKVRQYCINAFKRRIISSGLMSDLYTPEDLDGEAIILMENILSKFDKSVYKGKIAEHDVPGAGKPKTLEFYFKNYFSGRVNLTAAEAREEKMKYASKGSTIYGDLYYDDESEEKTTDLDFDAETIEYLLKIMDNYGYGFEFKRFFVQANVLQISKPELRDEYGNNFNKLLKKAEEFMKNLKDVLS